MTFILMNSTKSFTNTKTNYLSIVLLMEPTALKYNIFFIVPFGILV